MASKFKFRTWHKEAKTMEVCKKASDGFKWQEEGQPVVVMQSTGLVDKNGVEVYQDDIVLCSVTLEMESDSKEFSYYSTGPDNVRRKYCCKPKPCAVDITPICTEFLHSSGKKAVSWCNKKPSDLEVIGNIYENPELLGAAHG